MSRRLEHSDVAWLTLAAAVVCYELLAPPGQLLSEACDRYRRRRPLLTRAVIVGVGAHLLRVIPPRLDPLHHVAVRVFR